MRQIKFKGKRVDNGEWVEGLLVYLNEIRVFYDHSFVDENGNKVEYQTTEDIRISPSTVGQFTGLIDKNGKEIWEGDTGIDRFSRKVVVVWVDEFSCFALETIDDVIKGEYDFVLSDIFEINGNIHDNPKLIN